MKLRPCIEPDGWYAVCPKCFTEVFVGYDCSNCFQEIDWAWILDEETDDDQK